MSQVQAHAGASLVPIVLLCWLLLASSDCDPLNLCTFRPGPVCVCLLGLSAVLLALSQSLIMQKRLQSCAYRLFLHATW